MTEQLENLTKQSILVGKQPEDQVKPQLELIGSSGVLAETNCRDISSWMPVSSQMQVSPTCVNNITW